MDKTTQNSISYSTYGSGMPIIFLHGLSLDKESTSNFFEPFLSASKYQRIYLDLPGMGNSPALKQATTHQIVLAVISAIKQIIGNHPFVIYGHSFGGYVAQAIANVLSDQVLGLFLIGPVVTAQRSKRILGQHTNVFVDRVMPINNQEFFQDFLDVNVIITSKSWQNFQRLMIPGFKKADNTFIKTLQGNSYPLPNENELKSKNYSVPFTIMVGKNDQIVGYKEQLRLATNSELGEIFLLNKTGHNLMVDQPALTKSAFLHFLKTI